MMVRSEIPEIRTLSMTLIYDSKENKHSIDCVKYIKILLEYILKSVLALSLVTFFLNRSMITIIILMNPMKE